MKCPCKECISLAICRHKDYLVLFDQCSMVRTYISDHANYKKRSNFKVNRLCNVLKPTIWTYASNMVRTHVKGEYYVID